MIKSSKQREALSMDFGPLFITAGIAQAARDDVGFLSEILECLRRYQLGDWGDLCPEDMQLNEAALRTGARLMGAYTTKRGGKIWIITEAADDNGQRAATTVLLPDEY
jgi:hypothetical protein